MLALPLTKRLLSYTKLLSLLSQVTKGASLRHCHLIITRRARTINIIIIISTRKGLLSRLGWRKGPKTTKARLAGSDAIDSSVHLTHLIRQMVKTTTKISTHVLKLLHMSMRETSTLEEEEGADKEEGWEEGVVGVASIVSTSGCFATSCTTLLRIDSLIMAPMTWKWRGGMVGCMCVRMRVIAEGRMSLSCVVMSW